MSFLITNVIKHSTLSSNLTYLVLHCQSVWKQINQFLIVVITLNGLLAAMKDIYELLKLKTCLKIIISQNNYWITCKQKIILTPKMFSWSNNDGNIVINNNIKSTDKNIVINSNIKSTNKNIVNQQKHVCLNKIFHLYVVWKQNC